MVDQGLAVLIAASMGTLGILFTGRQQQRLQRRQHTFRVIERHNEWLVFDAALERVGYLTRNGRVPRRDERFRGRDIETIDFLLNYYEFLSSGIWCGDIDEALVRECEIGRLRRVHDKLADYIAWNRDESGSATMWRNLEQLAARWKQFPEGPDSLARSVEYLIGHPLRRINF
jgi:hypothetical protein